MLPVVLTLVVCVVLPLQVKLAFKLDTDGNPVDVAAYPVRDSNRVVEEFMLLANYFVAQQVCVSRVETVVVLVRQRPVGCHLVMFQPS
jgi:exoribonuclease R